jgi:DNA-binding NarL/FixJ family response regulator
MIRIALADDHKLFAKGLKSLIEEHPNLDVVDTFANGKDLLEYVSEQFVDIILTDLNMPIIDGLGVLRHCKKHHPKIKVIVLSMYDDEKIFKEAKSLGADAYLLKDADPSELIFTINEVYEGREIKKIEREIQDFDQSKYFDAFRLRYKLSTRETQVIKMIGDGMINKEIAEKLNLSIKTVETHRKNINQKLGVNSLLDLINKIKEINL